MRSACCGPALHSFRRRVLRPHAERAAAVGVLLALTACASDRSASYQPGYDGNSAAQSAAVQPPRVQTEGDGLPAQPPPLRRPTSIVDDPREPWSPNYGTVAPSRTAEVATPAVSVPQSERESAKIVAAVKPVRFSLFQAEPIDADDIVRRAIAEHEMRRED